MTHPSRRGLVLAAVALGASCARSAGPPGPLTSSIGVSVPYEVDSLDPHARDSLSHIATLSNFYEPLVTTDAEMKVRPCLAESWETPDASTWLFHLRPGVAFHSGRALEAEDAVYSIRRLLGTPSLEMRGYVLHVAEVSAPDRRTVRVRTRRPLSILPNKLRFVSIVPRGSPADSLASRPDGTGPYVMQEWNPGQWIRMTRHERYWGPRPAFARVDVSLDRSPEESIQDLLSGRSQLAQCNSRKAADRLAVSGRLVILRRPSLFLHYLGFDTRREVTPYAAVKPNPFRSVLVRRAFHLGIDRRKLAAELPGGAVPATQPVLPFIFGFNPRIREPVHDPGRARQLLEQAGLRDGLGAVLHVRKTFADAAVLVRDQLRAIGIRLEVDVMTEAEFRSHTSRRDTSLFLARFGATTGDLSEVLDNCVHTHDEADGKGLFNFGGYSNPDLDAAIDSSTAIERTPDRRAVLDRILETVMEDLPLVPLFFPEDVYALDTRLSWQPRSDSLVLAAEIAPGKP